MSFVLGLPANMSRLCERGTSPTFEKTFDNASEAAKAVACAIMTKSSPFTLVGLATIFDVFANADDARHINACTLRDTQDSMRSKTTQLLKSMEKGSPTAWQKKARWCLLSPRDRTDQNIVVPSSWPDVDDAKVVVTHLLSDETCF